MLIAWSLVPAFALVHHGLRENPLDAAVLDTRPETRGPDHFVLEIDLVRPGIDARDPDVPVRRRAELRARLCRLAIVGDSPRRVVRPHECAAGLRAPEEEIPGEKTHRHRARTRENGPSRRKPRGPSANGAGREAGVTGC